MKTLKFEDKESWEEARIGKITGTKLKDLISLKGSVKKGFWKLVAERLSLPADDEILYGYAPVYPELAVRAVHQLA